MKELTETKFKLDSELQKCIEELKQLEKDNANTELDKQRKAKIEANWQHEEHMFQLEKLRKQKAAESLFKNYLDHKLRKKNAKKKGKKRRWLSIVIPPIISFKFYIKFNK